MDTGGIGGAGRRIFGVVCGVVVDNHHPTGEYRVKVKFPWIRSTEVGDEEDFISAWARVASPFAGDGRGFYCLPEQDDEVLVIHPAAAMPSRMPTTPTPMSRRAAMTAT